MRIQNASEAVAKVAAAVCWFLNQHMWLVSMTHLKGSECGAGRVPPSSVVSFIEERGRQ